MPDPPTLTQRIALEVLGWRMYHYDKDSPSACYWMLLDADGDPAVFAPRWADMEQPTEAAAWAVCPDFAGDWVAAGWLVEHLRGQGWRFDCGVNGVLAGWSIAARGPLPPAGRPIRHGYAYGESFPATLCSAILQAGGEAPA